MTKDSFSDGRKPVYSNGGAVIGELVTCADGKWLEKSGLDPSRHQLHRPPAWATDEAHLEMLRGLGARGLRLYTKDGTLWEARLDAFDRFGIAVCRGHGPQVALPLCHWNTTDARQGRQLEFPFGGAA